MGTVAAVNIDTLVTFADLARFIAEVDAASITAFGAAFTVDRVAFSCFFVTG